MKLRRSLRPITDVDNQGSNVIPAFAVARRLEMKAYFYVFNVAAGSFSDARRKSLSVRYVPEAEVNQGDLNVSYWES